VQATVYRFDADVHVGSVLTDDGLVVPFGAAAFATSGLRHLRPGQRLTVELTDAASSGRSVQVAAMRLETIRPQH
jgi:2-phospho-L-lactate guanylyltransferase